MAKWAPHLALTVWHSAEKAKGAWEIVSLGHSQAGGEGGLMATGSTMPPTQNTCTQALSSRTHSLLYTNSSLSTHTHTPPLQRPHVCSHTTSCTHPLSNMQLEHTHTSFSYRPAHKRTHSQLQALSALTASPSMVPHAPGSLHLPCSAPGTGPQGSGCWKPGWTGRSSAR
jgi:hypothetical protein